MAHDRSPFPFSVPYVALSTVSPSHTVSMDPDNRRNDKKASPNKRRRINASGSDFNNFAAPSQPPSYLSENQYLPPHLRSFYEGPPNPANNPFGAQQPYMWHPPSSFHTPPDYRNLPFHRQTQPPMMSQPLPTRNMGRTTQHALPPIQHGQLWPTFIPQNSFTPSMPYPETSSPRRPRTPNRPIPNFTKGAPGKSYHPDPDDSSPEPPPRQKFPKGALLLSLFLATHKNIAEIAEHKRECPACQLDLESGNFVATITCCDTYMHVICLSTWVNSTLGYLNARPKTCMKCRKEVDVRRKLNRYVKPLEHKEWDRVPDFGVPSRLSKLLPMDLDLRSTPPPRFRQSVPPNGSFNPLCHDEVPNQMRQEYGDIMQRHAREMGPLINRCRETHEALDLGGQRHARHTRILNNAQEERQNGGPITGTELEGLMQSIADFEDELDRLLQQRAVADRTLADMQDRHMDQIFDFNRRMMQDAASRRTPPPPILESSERSTLAARRRSEDEQEPRR